MAIDGKKLAAWIVGFALLGAFLVFRNEKPAPRPEPPPIVVTIPAPAPAVAPPVSKPVPPVQQPAPLPAAKPKPAPKKVAPKPPVPAVPRRQAPRCAHVPAEAYEHGTGIVIATAKGRGVSGADLDTLKWCIGAVS